MKTLGIIPSRYESSRFPGKPLIDLNGKTMIRRVYEQATKALDYVVVATDDKRIFDHVKSFGGQVVMTSNQHLNGTCRCKEALKIYSEQLNQTFDIVINVQGDEPLINPLAIKELESLFIDKNTEIGTLVNLVKYNDELNNPNRVKVVLDNDLRALYFSRSIMPYVRNKEILNDIKFYMHLGVYAYRVDILNKIADLEPSMLENAESLEQNRWIENSFYLKVKITDFQSIGIDVPEDVQKILHLLK